MDLIIREYEVHSRRDGAALIGSLAEAGYNVKPVIANMSRSARLPEKLFYCVWTDGTVTHGDEAVGMPEIKAANYQGRTYSETTVIEPLNIMAL